MAEKRKYTVREVLSNLRDLCTREIVPTEQSTFYTLLRNAFHGPDGGKFEELGQKKNYVETLREVQQKRSQGIDDRLKWLYTKLYERHVTILQIQRPPDEAVTLETQLTRMRAAFENIINRAPSKAELEVIEAIIRDNVKLLGPIRQACMAILKDLPPDPPRATTDSA